MRRTKGIDWTPPNGISFYFNVPSSKWLTSLKWESQDEEDDQDEHPISTLIKAMGFIESIRIH